MLIINVSSSGKSQLKFSNFEDYQLPAPINGVDAEINGDVILRFEDEDEAIDYAGQLEDIAMGLSDKTTPQYLAINDIIVSIFNDEFVKSYSR
jgi:hypothetical protein